VIPWRRVVEGFSETAENYAASMAPSLRTMAVAVVQRAQLRDGDQILDAGTGTGVGAAGAMTRGREVVGVDAAPGMLAIARREVPGARFVEADYGALPFPSGSFDVVISVHALHFAENPVAVLGEWRRVTTGGGRLSLSVPGPRAALSFRLYDPVYRRHGLLRRVETPTRLKLLTWARAAGWRRAKVEADPTTTIRLAGPDSFERWMRTGSRSGATSPRRSSRLRSSRSRRRSETRLGVTSTCMSAPLPTA